MREDALMENIEIQIHIAEDNLKKLHSQMKFLLMNALKLKDIYPMDFLCIAACTRCFSNIAAFQVLFKEQNLLAFSAIVRLQLDTLLRLFAIRICKHKQELAKKIALESTELRKLTWELENGKKHNLTDTFLCEQLETVEKIDWASKVYRQTSGFIHPSANHFFASLTHKKQEKDGTLHIQLRIDTFGQMPENQQYYLDAISCFNHITFLICKYLAYWAGTKKLLSEKAENKSIF